MLTDVPNRQALQQETELESNPEDLSNSSEGRKMEEELFAQLAKQEKGRPYEHEEQPLTALKCLNLVG